MLTATSSGISNQPLECFYRGSTLPQYWALAVCILTFLLREKEIYLVPIPDALEDALADLLQALEGNSQEDRIISLHEVLVQLWMRDWMATTENRIPCPTMWALALLSLHEDGSHRTAKENTNDFARIQRLIRLSCLYQIKDLSAKRFGGDDEKARDFVARWFVEKNYSTFSHVRSLQHRTSAIAFATIAMPQVWWVDCKNYTHLLYKGDRVHIDQLRQAFSDMEPICAEKWEEGVLCGLQLQMNYDFIHDDLTNRAVGYSFLSDPRNHCFDDKQILARAILNHPVLSARFTTPCSKGSGVRWAKPALLHWLQEYAEHGCNMLTRNEMLGGGPGRGTELACLRMRNTEVHI